MKLSDLPPPDHVGEVARLLARGKRKSAAILARRYAESAGNVELSALARVLCDALEETGNSHGGRGAPKRGGDSVKPWTDKGYLLNTRIEFAASALAEAKLCRDLVDGREVSADGIANYAVRGCGLSMGGNSLTERVTILANAINADSSALVDVTDYLLPFATATLKELALQDVPRRGFTGIASRKIAKRYRVSETQIKRAPKG